MMKEEFEKIAKTSIDNENYRLLEKVYMFHPCISATDGKKQIAMLYNEFGMAVILDMLDTAQRFEEIDKSIRAYNSKIKELEQAKGDYVEIEFN